MNFFIKEDYLNYSMLKESLLAYLLDKYTLYRTLTINITFKCFYCKAIKLLSSQQRPQNVNEKFNLSLTGKSSLFLCLAVATEIKTNEWTELELYKLT